MYGNNNQQQSFPSPNSFQANDISVHPGQPPFLINVPCSPNIAPFVPYVITAAINLIQQKKQINPLRLVLFNLMAQKGYQNNSFYELIKYIVGAIELDLAGARNYNVSPDQVIDKAVNMVTEAFCGINLQRIPQLAQQIDANTVMGASNAMGGYMALIQQIERGVSNQPQQQFFNPQQQNAPFRGNNQAVFAPGNSNTGDIGIFSGRNFWNSNENINGPAPSRFDSPGGTTSWPNSFGNNTAVGAPVFSGRFSSDSSSPVFSPVAETVNPFNTQAFAPVAEVVQPVSAEDAVIMKRLDIVRRHCVKEGYPGEIYHWKDPSVTWKNSKEETNPIAFDPNEFDIYYRQTADGVFHIHKLRIPKEENMDRNVHLMVPQNLKPTASVELGAKIGDVTVAEVTEMVKEELVLTLDDGPKEPDEITKLSVSDEEVWLSTKYKLSLIDKTKNKIRVAHRFASVNKAIFVPPSIKAFCSALINAGTFTGAVVLLIKEKSGVENSAAGSVSRTAFNFVNFRLTNALNSFIKNVLGLGGVFVESFIGDGNNIIDYFSERYSAYHKKLQLAQQEILNDALQFCDDAGEQLISDAYFQDEDGYISPAEVSYFYTLDQFVAVDLSIEQLRTEFMVSNSPVVLFENNSQLLFSICQLMANKEKTAGMKCVRHLLITNDDTIIRFERNRMTENESYIISVI